MFGATSVTAIAVISLVLGLVLRKKKMGGDAVVWLFLIAGFGLAGVLGDLLVSIGGAIQNGGTVLSQTLGGVPVPTLAAIALTAWLIIDILPKSTTGKNAPWLALIVPSVWLATGGMWAELNATGDNLVATAGQSLSTFAEQLVAGL
jgi:hypothetical protein